MTLEDILKDCPNNLTIKDSIIKSYHKINNDIYTNILCSISGGGDSDVVIDICRKCDNKDKIDYVWFDTGLEYQATKDHLKYLEKKYGVEIKRYKAIKPIPLTCREYGQPFVSKFVSDMIYRLQRHNFKFEDKSFEELSTVYPKIVSVIKWWCNEYKPLTGTFNIARNAWLKEFLVINPPNFKISSKCCQYAKKDIMHKLIKDNEYELNISGIRKAEGGIRSSMYKNCFDENENSCDNYRPLFWYKDEDKEAYEKSRNVIHSKCYTEYGLKRTGCVGCPFGKDFEQELKIIEKYEPKLYKAVNNIFGNSYEYTRKYKEFCKEMNKKYGSYSAYLREKSNFSK